ncbi:substrate-binding periplasmic protein [Bowmanella dokdonensis]|uniref:Transporter substrate-binding domain-containing protein n=1 Tax=Bowmanella dokdonensis TaxID=751969 RepID=A0A939DRC6_9ALTE|nr:transporter substrate-binding domain-containing protein [Bowmanella dokdonensis]MBN7826481.1 transporter substrate-binding domain-containing protein [Bowmanella dokdonensis]
MRALILTLLCCIWLALPVYAKVDGEPAQPMPELELLTEDYAPYNYRDAGELKGFSVELVEELLTMTGSAQRRDDIQVLPWARAYQLGLLRPNTLLFTLTYTEQREPLFRWIGPLIPTKVVVIAKRSMDLRARSVEDLRGLVIGTVAEDVGEQLLLEKGFAVRNLVSEASPQEMMKQFKRNRYNAVAYSDISAYWYLRDMGEDLQDYQVMLVLQESHQYFGLSRQTPQYVETRLQQALDELQQSDRYQQLLGEYPAIQHAVAAQQ